MSRYSRMRNTNRRGYMSVRHTYMISRCEEQKNIICTKHAIDRLNERMVLTGLNDEAIRDRLTDMVSRSRLVSLSDGQELREYRGVAFACRREFRKGEQKLIVITVLLTTTKQKELMKGGMDRFVSYAELAK